MKTNRISLKYVVAVGVLGALSLASLGFAAKPSLMPAGCKGPAGWNACVSANCAGLHGNAANYCIFQCSKAFCY
jgi:hypothetical protein